MGVFYLHQRCERNEGFKTRTKRKRRVFKKPNVERIERRLKRTKTLFFQTWNENQHTFCWYREPWGDVLRYTLREEKCESHTRKSNDFLTLLLRIECVRGRFAA